jgi:hypothetical protein
VVVNKNSRADLLSSREALRKIRFGTVQPLSITGRHADILTTLHDRIRATRISRRAAPINLNVNHPGNR